MAVRTFRLEVFVAVEHNVQPGRKFFQNFAPQFPEKEVRKLAQHFSRARFALDRR